MDINSNIRGVGSATGIDSYVVSALSVNDAAYVDKASYIIAFVSANTGASTLDINGIGSKPIINAEKIPLVAGDIVANSVLHLIYDSVSDSFITTFKGSVAPGESNTASNLGAGEGVFATKVGVDLQFKSLVAGTNITLTPSGTEILIDAASGPDTNIYNSDGTISAIRTITLTNQLLFDVSLSGNILIENGATPIGNAPFKIGSNNNSIFATFSTNSIDKRSTIEFGNSANSVYIDLLDDQPGAAVLTRISGNDHSFFALDSGARLGIGTNAPTTDFHIEADTLFTVTSGGGGESVKIDAGTGYAIFEHVSPDDVRLLFVNSAYTIKIGVPDFAGTSGAISVDDGTQVFAGSPPACLNLAHNSLPLVVPVMQASTASLLPSAGAPDGGQIVYVTDTNATFTSIGFWGNEAGTWVKL